MTGFKEYSLPVVFALVLHALLLWLMIHRFSEAPALVIKKPEIIKATLVQRKQVVMPNNKNSSDQLERARKEKQEKLNKAKKERAKKLEQKRQQDLIKREADQKKQAELKKQAEIEQKKKRDVEKKRQEQLEQEKVRAKKEQAIREQRILDELADEEESIQNAAKEAADEAQAMSYMGVIRSVIEGNWNRPPSARNGMEVMLDIRLVPNGSVIQVNIVKGSGNAAFDRSAVVAVEKSERFSELSELPSHVFEKYYRQFRILFKPEDLRL